MKDLKDIVHKINTMAEKDQKVRNEKPLDEEKLQKIDEQNRKEMKNIIEEHGLITISKFGKEASYNAWLLVQHFPREEVKLMKKYLTYQSRNMNDINIKNFAYLEDRINMYTGKPQKYGTQTTWDGKSKSLIFHKLIDVARVDEFRKEYGLKPLWKYIIDLQKYSEYSIILPEGYKNI